MGQHWSQKPLGKNCLTLLMFITYICVFQLLKCGECSYCTLNPPRLPEHIFEGLHFLPDAVMVEGEYKSFEQVYGTETDDSDRPSASKVPETTERDKNFKSLLVASKE